MQYPFKYYEDWQKLKNTETVNNFDHFPTRLPPNVIF